MPKDAQYPKDTPISGEGGTLPEKHRDTGSGSKMGGLAQPTGKSRPTVGPQSSAANPSYKGIPGTLPKSNAR